MLQRTGTLWIAVLTSLLSACASAPPSTVPELAAQLSRNRVLFDQARVAEIIGSPGLQRNSPTRIPGVTLTYAGDWGNGDQMRGVQFDLTKTCTRISDFEQRFGKP